MLRKPGFLILAAALSSAPAFAEPSEQHSVKSANYSALAVSHASAAAGTVVAKVVAVPILAFGGAVTVSGAALTDSGAGALAIGTDLSRAGHAGAHAEPALKPNGPPKLD